MRNTSLLILSLLLITGTSACSDQDKVKVQRMDLVQGVYASGNIQPVGFYEVKTKVSGVLDEIFVEIGQAVEAGTPLLKISNRPSEMNLQIAKNQYELALKNAATDSDLLSELKRQVENSSATYQQDSLEFRRYQSLREEGIGSESEFDRIRLRYRTSKNNFQITKSRLSETQDRLEIELKNAQNNYLAQQSLTGDYTLLSIMNGRIYNIAPETGEILSPNQIIMEIGSNNEFEAELQVDETDIALIRPGQQVFYELDAVDDTVFSGAITLIYPRINTIERTARVMASIDPLGYDLYPGMALEANIVIDEKTDILVIPAGYVTQDDEVVLEDGSLKKIRTGIRDINYIEILSGLEEGDIVLKPGS